MLAEFLALYRGQTVSDAELVAISAEPRIVRKFFRELLGEHSRLEPDAEAAGCSQQPELVRNESAEK